MSRENQKQAPKKHELLINASLKWVAKVRCESGVESFAEAAEDAFDAFYVSYYVQDPDKRHSAMMLRDMLRELISIHRQFADEDFQKMAKFNFNLTNHAAVS